METQMPPSDAGRRAIAAAMAPGARTVDGWADQLEATHAATTRRPSMSQTTDDPIVAQVRASRAQRAPGWQERDAAGLAEIEADQAATLERFRNRPTPHRDQETLG